MLIQNGSSTTACSNRYVVSNSDPKLSVLGGINNETHLGIAGIGEDGAFPTTAIAARESWLKDSKNREIALNFLRAFTDGLTLARTNAAISKKVLRKYTRVDDEAVLQATFEYYRKYFGETLKVNERSYANLLQLLDHPKAKDADPKRFFDNSLLEQIRR
jgi:ABC-type nitrate/sulfonate/bicarbonate transport system substrate-binding protein